MLLSLCRFEKQLKAKIMQKNAPNMHEVQFMSKMFKYFDSQKRGKVTFEQFYRAMEKLGISMDQQVSKQRHGIIDLQLSIQM